MEAKDTVMSDREIKSVLLEVADRYYDAEIQVTVSHTALAQTQAEISFKFGYEQGLREQGSPRADAEIRLADEEYAREFRKEWIEDEKLIEPFKAGKEAGIREVVKDLEMIDKESYDTRDFARRVCDLIVDWQVKLKEWQVQVR